MVVESQVKEVKSLTQNCGTFIYYETNVASLKIGYFKVQSWMEAHCFLKAQQSYASKKVRQIQNLCDVYQHVEYWNLIAVSNQKITIIEKFQLQLCEITMWRKNRKCELYMCEVLYIRIIISRMDYILKQSEI